MKTISLIALLTPAASQKLSNHGLNPRKTLYNCQGDCDHDHQCKGKLKCYQRNGKSPVPGCTGTGKRAWDYCYDPDIVNMAKDYTTVKDYGWTPKGSTLGKCVGDCDHNGHCKGNLKCFFRRANEKIPGCGGYAQNDLDVCVSQDDIDKMNMAKDYTSLRSYGWTPKGSILGKCVGDCDHDGNCRGGLKCQQRSKNEAVWGCSGTGFSGQDFCYDPKDVTSSPTKRPTDSPTDSPTASPTESPTAKCDPNNCMNWECADWCECYDDEHADVYNSHQECQADGDDTCICFQEEGDEHPKEVLPGTERHRKIHYRHD